MNQGESTGSHSREHQISIRLDIDRLVIPRQRKPEPNERQQRIGHYLANGR
jgi:hypothetical protein